MTVHSDENLETQIAAWRSYMRRRRAVHTDVEELEDHLRASITDLMRADLRRRRSWLP